MNKFNSFSALHIIIALLCAIIGITFMWFGMSKNISLISNIGSVVLISGIYTIIDNMLLKNSLVDIIIQKVNIKKELDNIGLIQSGSDLKKIQYHEMLTNAKHNIDIIHNYGRTWTNSNYDYVKDAIWNRKCKVRIALLNPESLFVPALEKHYEYEKGELEKNIIKTTERWKKLAIELNQNKQKNTGSVELYYFNGQPTDSLYRIDEKIIIINTKNSKSQTVLLPFSIYEKNNTNGLYDIFLQEIDNIIKDATKVEL